MQQTRPSLSLGTSPLKPDTLGGRNRDTFDKNGALIRLSESTGTDFGRVGFDARTAPQKVFSAIWQLESLVNNGGFDAYFRYTDSEVIRHTPEALRAIGALRCSAIVERALQLFGSLPPTREGRENVLDALAADDALDVLDREFLAYPDDITELLFAFVVERPETFGPISQGARWPREDRLQAVVTAVARGL